MGVVQLSGFRLNSAADLPLTLYKQNLCHVDRSLLNLTQQFSKALQAASSDQPLIYGLELMGESHILEQIRTESIVSASNTVGEVTVNNQQDNYESLKPVSYRSDFKDQSIQAAGAEKIYELLHAANFASRKGDS